MLHFIFTVPDEEGMTLPAFMNEKTERGWRLAQGHTDIQSRASSGGLSYGEFLDRAEPQGRGHHLLAE